MPTKNIHCEIVTTGDGLHSLFVPELNEHYHSIHGALNEARHVFLQAGFSKALERFPELRILEVGFGTGLNFFLTLLEAERLSVKVEYEGVELYPLAAELVSRLNYAELIGPPAEAGVFLHIHQLPWNEKHIVGNAVTLVKSHQPVQELVSPSGYHLIYFDAFGFRAQEEMWAQEIFDLMYSVLVPGGILVTYSSMGIVRRRMQQSGFVVEKIPGPPGKREMVRAFKPLSNDVN